MSRQASNLDMQGNQLLSAALQDLSGHPASPVVGQMYYNTTLNKSIYLEE